MATTATRNRTPEDVLTALDATLAALDATIDAALSAGLDQTAGVCADAAHHVQERRDAVARGCGIID